MDRGIFITFEGGEGTGKSTQIGLLRQAFAEAALDLVATREPGGTDQAEKIRSLLVQRDGGEYDPLTEALLLFAGRREHLVKKILPALEKGQWVVSDRFADSTRAMQGNGMGLEQEKIEAIYKVVAGDFAPDLTFILDIDPKVGLARSNKRLQAAADAAGKTEDRYERMSLQFHEKLRAGFLEIARKNPERCFVIDATQDPQEMHRQIIGEINRRYGTKLKEVKLG